MEKKKKKNSSAGLVVVLLIAAFQLIAKAGRSEFLAVLVAVLLLAVLFYTIFRTRSRQNRDSEEDFPRPAEKIPFTPESRSGGSGFPEEERSARNRREPRGRNRRTADVDRTEREDKRSAAACGENLSFRDAEQWKSLFEAGLIDREEYRERRNKMGKRG